MFDGVKIDGVMQMTREKGAHMEDLRRELVSRKYSPNTIKGYIHYNEKFLKFAGKGTGEIENDDVKRYFFYSQVGQYPAACCGYNSLGKTKNRRLRNPRNTPELAPIGIADFRRFFLSCRG